MERNTPDHSDTAFRRMQQIEDCLYDMLKTRPYSSVSVSDICKKLEISRMTFYQYYESKDACFCSVIDHILRQTMIHINSDIPSDAKPLEVCIRLLEFWRSHWHASTLTSNTRLDSLVLDRCVHFVLNEDIGLLFPFPVEFKERDPDILACCIAAIYTLNMQWYSRGCDTPIEEIARKYLRILRGLFLILDGEIPK